MPVALTDAEILDAERRARAALRTAPPTLSPTDAPNVFTLEAQREVLDFIREAVRINTLSRAEQQGLASEAWERVEPARSG